MSNYEQDSFYRFKDAMCGAFCVDSANCKWCILRKLTRETIGKYRIKDLLKYPKKEVLRRYGKIH